MDPRKPAAYSYSTAELEGPFQVSMWLTLPALMDAQELGCLFEALGEFRIHRIGSVLSRQEGNISREAFLACYGAYIGDLKEGRAPTDPRYRQYLSAALTVDDEAVYAVALPDERHIIKIRRPVLQLQPHTLGYSPLDGKFRSMVRGENTVSWGVQYGYPQVFQNPKTGAIEKIDQSESFPNTALFRKLQRWVRHNTLPTPFEVGGVRTNVPIRLGKQCFSWINRHPQLVAQGIRVVM